MSIDNESKIRKLSKDINKLSSKFDHDFEELLESGLDYEFIASTMQDDLTYEIEKIVTRFELTNPDLYIVGIFRHHDDESNNPEVVLDWIDLTDEEE